MISRAFAFNSLLAFFVLLLSGAAIAQKQTLSYPDIGIFSANRADLFRVKNRIYAEADSIPLTDRESPNCKEYVERVPLAKLKRIAVFTDDDLLPMTPDTAKEFGPESVYFESCNYFRYFPLYGRIIVVLISGEFDQPKNELLDWGHTDAYIDTEHALLLIKYLNEPIDPETGSPMVSMLLIDKYKQISTNKKIAKGQLLELIEVATGLRFGGSDSGESSEIKQKKNTPHSNDAPSVKPPEKVTFEDVKQAVSDYLDNKFSDETE